MKMMMNKKYEKYTRVYFFNFKCKGVLNFSTQDPVGTTGEKPYPERAPYRDDDHDDHDDQDDWHGHVNRQPFTGW